MLVKALVNALTQSEKSLKLDFEWVRGFDVSSNPSKDLRNQLICAVLQLTSNYVDEHIENLSKRIEGLKKDSRDRIDASVAMKTLVSLEDIIQARDWWKTDRPLVVKKIDEIELKLKSDVDRDNTVMVEMFSEYVSLLDKLDANDGKALMYVICGVGDL